MTLHLGLLHEGTNLAYGCLRTVVLGWRNLHNEELHDLYTASNMARMIKYGRMRWRDGTWHA